MMVLYDGTSGFWRNRFNSDFNRTKKAMGAA
jgi:hypothetical protein